MSVPAGAEMAGGRLGVRRLEVPAPLAGGGLALLRMDGVEEDQGHHGHPAAPAQDRPTFHRIRGPARRWRGVEPDAEQGGDHVRPVGDSRSWGSLSPTFLN